MSDTAYRRRQPRRRSSGVMLRNRAAGLHRWRDEIRVDGGKAKLHRQIRRAERHALRRGALDDR